jgi:predicted secreted protein
MKWTSILAIFLLFWVLSAFLVMPFHVRTADETGGELVPGQAESAPHDFKPLRIVLWTTLVATLLFGLYYGNYVNGWITPEMLDFSGQS